MSTDGELLTFLNARLDEDAAVAKAAIEEYATGFADTWSFEGYAESVTDGFGGYVACGPYDGPVDEGQGRHIARFDPKRKLREITVDLLILELHTGEHNCRDQSTGRYPADWPSTAAYGSPGAEWRHVVDEYFEEGCLTARLMANKWIDHADFRPEWTEELCNASGR